MKLSEKGINQLLTIAQDDACRSEYTTNIPPDTIVRLIKLTKEAIKWSRHEGRYRELYNAGYEEDNE